MLKVEKPFTPLFKIQEKLEENANVTVSKNTLSRTVRTKLSGSYGKPWSLKRLHKPAGERFTYDNLRYTKTFLQAIAAADPVRLRFF